MVNAPEQVDSTLRDYIDTVVRRKWTVVAITLAVVVSALVASFLQVPVYEARAELLLQDRSSERLFDVQSGQFRDPIRTIQTQIKVLRSEPVRTAVIDRIGVAPAIAAVPVGQTDVIELRSRSTNPERAATIVNAYANAYVEVRRTSAVEDLLSAADEIQRKVDDLQTQIDRTGDPATKQLLIGRQLAFKQTLDRLQVDASLKTGGAQIVTSALPPTAPVEPKPVRNAMVAFSIGSILGLALAFLLEYLDDAIKGKSHVESILPEAPVLAVIPAVPDWRDRRSAQVVTLVDPTSNTAEAYRALRTSVQFLELDQPIKVIQVCSSRAGEGKTTTVANLAVALAQTGQRVIVVDCDLRRPRLHSFFDVTNDVGFTSVLLGQVPLAGALQRVPELGRVVVLASGPLPPNPSELLAGRRTADLIAALQVEADIVIIDSPPVLPVTDAAVLSSRADATLVVVGPKTTAKQLGITADTLKRVNAPIVGTVLNGFGEEEAYGYRYGYRYGYGYGGYRSATDDKSPPRRFPVGR